MAPRRSLSPSSPEKLRVRHKRDKRDRLRAAAWDLFTTKGYDETTTREVAERAGVATGTLFLYAKDKADLLFLVFEENLAETVEDAFRSLPEVNLDAQLQHVFRRCFAMYAKSPAIGRKFVKELPGATGPNADRVNGLTLAFLQRIAGLVEKAQERGEVRREVAPILAAQTVFAIYFMTLLTWLSGFNSLETAVQTMFPASLSLLIDGLAPRAPSV